MMEIVVDTREPDHIVSSCEAHAAELQNKTGITIRISSFALQSGDFCIRRDGSPIMYIERKTWGDLAASIKDGRAESQWERLSQLLTDGFRVAWLIEGKLPNTTGDTNGIKNVCLHGMICSMVAMGYQLIHCANADITAHVIVGIAKHLMKEPVFSTVTERFINQLKVPSYLNDDVKVDLGNLISKFGGVSQDTVPTDPPSFNPLPTVKSMWKCILGNSKIIDGVMSMYTIKEMLNNADLVDELRYDNGRKIQGRDRIKAKIMDDTICKDIVGCVKGVSDKRAEFIYSKIGSQLRNLGETVALTMDGRSLDKSILPRYIECINFKKNRTANI